MKTYALNSLAAGVGLLAAVHAAEAAQVAGAVNYDGSKQIPSNAYSVVHGGQGYYIIEFKKGFDPSPVCMFTPVSISGGAAIYVLYLTEDQTTCRVVFASTYNTSVIDTPFNFLAVTPTK